MAIKQKLFELFYYAILMYLEPMLPVSSQCRILFISFQIGKNSMFNRTNFKHHLVVISLSIAHYLFYLTGSYCKM